MDWIEEGIRDNLNDSQDVWSNICACGFSTFNHTLGELADVTVGRIENDSNDRSGPEYREHRPQQRAQETRQAMPASHYD